MRRYLFCLSVLLGVTCVVSQDCTTIRCDSNHECDDITQTCVPITCDARDACRPGEKCVPKPVYCTRSPCPQFECVPTCEMVDCFPGHSCYDSDSGATCVPVTCEAENACDDKFETCEPAENVCTSTPCPQFNCVPKLTCASYDCLPGDYTCVDYPEGPRCVPLTCNAPDACPKDNTCTPVEQTCSSQPCQQFICEDCIICPHSIPFCSPDCNNCVIIPQTCTTCARAVCEDACVFCTRIFPTCVPGCENCEIKPQTCDSCAEAVCTDCVACKELECPEECPLRCEKVDSPNGCDCGKPICMGCKDKVPSLLEYKNEPIECAELKKVNKFFCSDDEVKRRCPHSCDVCSAGDNRAQLESIVSTYSLQDDNEENRIPLYVGAVGSALLVAVAALAMFMRLKIRKVDVALEGKLVEEAPENRVL